MENTRSIKVCYFGTYRNTYNRNQMMIAGLRLNDVTVIECHETLWHGIGDRVKIASGGWKQPRFWWRIIRVYWRLIIRYLRLSDHDIVIVGYPGQLDVFIARILSWLRHKPLVWDILMSIYLIAIERGLDEKNELSMKLLHFVENTALKLPDMLIMDTRDYIDWFFKNYQVNPKKFRLVPIGADDRIFAPAAEQPKEHYNFRVVYTGTYIPNHGVKYIVDAAKELLDRPEIIFELIGEGPELGYVQQYKKDHALENVHLIDWITKDELVKRLQQADVCLGAFGNTPQSMMTVQNKLYEAMAMAIPLISGDSPAVRRICNHLENIYLCERESGTAIADAILTLFNNETLCNKIGQNGYKLFLDKYNLQKNGQLFRMNIAELLE